MEAKSPTQDQPLNGRRTYLRNPHMLSQGRRAKLISILGILRLDITYESLSLLIPALEILPGLDWEPVGDFPFD